MRNSDAPNPALPLIPLARDAAGFVIALPDGAAAWRVRRNTRGRPGNIVGTDGKLLTVPLGFSEDDLFGLLGDGSYRLDPVNDTNEVIKMIGPPITIGDPEPANTNEPVDDSVLATLPASVSDTRFVLEANVRAMQLSFQHNQRTLELGLQMADTLRAGVHVLAETQADCMKALVGSRSFFRNAGPAQLPAPAPVAEQLDDEDDDEDEEEDAPADWVQQLQPMVALVVQQIVTMVMNRSKSPTTTTTKTSSVKELIGDALDWRRVAKRNEVASTEPAKRTLADVAKMLPASLMMKLASLQTILTPVEASNGMAMIMALEPEMVSALVERLEPLSVEEIASFLREQLTKGAQLS